MVLRYGSICSGIEGATVAWHPLGWQPVFFAEIEPFCCALLRHHYPDVPNLGNFTKIGTEVPCGAVDLVIGGTPCQPFSVAGHRAGLADPRGNLTLEYFALLDRLRPRWMVWENVPGLLSDDDGRTFGTCLGLLAECGYGFAYRLLDAQYFGVPQRRRRLFLVGYRGDWRPPAATLFEKASFEGILPVGLTTACQSQPVSATLTKEYSRGDYGRGRPLLFDEGSYAFRTFTPLEMERIQGFPDHYTLIPYLEFVDLDIKRQAALGNSFAVPVVRWIGERLQRVNDLLHEQESH